jgi:hypothetical protein
MSRMGDYYEEMKENGNWSEADEYYKSMWEDEEEGEIFEAIPEGVITNQRKLKKALIKEALWHETKDGEIIYITNITDSHLNNLIKYYETRRAILDVNMPSIDTHAWDDAIEAPVEYVLLKDSSLFHTIKYDLFLKERKRRK